MFKASYCKGSPRSPVHLELSDARLHRRTRYSQHTTRASSTGQESATVSCSQSMLRSPFFCSCSSPGSVGRIHATAGLHPGPPYRTKKRRARNRWVHDRIATVSGHRNRQCAGPHCRGVRSHLEFLSLHFFAPFFVGLFRVARIERNS
jgi:hypothetical protein